MKVIALIGDVVASKQQARRDVLQKKLAAALAKLNESARGLASPYTLTLGDEFQAVYRRADSLLTDVVVLLAAVHPVQVRFALGVGSLSTPVNPKQALGMDGPAFHSARETLSALKEDENLLRIAGSRAEEWTLVNHVLNLLSHQIKGWSYNRLCILAGLLAGKKVREIEPGLKVSGVAVYKNIRAAALDDVVGICQQLTVLLNSAVSDK